jgi:hypothetical protein
MIESYFNWQTKEEVAGGWIHVESKTVACRRPSWLPQPALETKVTEVKDEATITAFIVEADLPTSILTGV